MRTDTQHFGVRTITPPDATLGVNVEVLNLHLCMNYCEFALGDEAKGY